MPILTTTLRPPRSSGRLAGLGQLIDPPVSYIDVTPSTEYFRLDVPAYEPSIWEQIGSVATGLFEAVGKYGVPAIQSYGSMKQAMTALKSQQSAARYQAAAEISAAEQQKKMLEIQQAAQREQMAHQLELARLHQTAQIKAAQASAAMVPTTHMTSATTTGTGLKPEIDTNTILIAGGIGLGAILLMTVLM